MIANQIKSIALTSLLVVGTVSTGVIVGASQLSGGSANAGKGNQVPAACDRLGRVQAEWDGRHKLLSAKPELLLRSVSPQLAQQLSASRPRLASSCPLSATRRLRISIDSAGGQ